MFGALSSYYNNYAEDAQNRADEAKTAEEREQGATIISYDLQAISWNSLRRKRAFYSGVPLTLKEEFAAPQKLLDFHRLPDVLPIKPRKPFTGLDYNDLIKWDKPFVPEEVKGEEGEEKEEQEQGPPVDQHLFQYEFATAEDKKSFLSKFELVRRRKIKVDEKPVCIINDPYAGGREVIMPMVEKRFNEAEIKFNTHTSEGNPMDVFNMAKDMDLSEYSLLCVTGDDNTFQEAVNGVLAREDGAKLPFGFIPNACTSDFLYSVGIMSTEIALDNIIKAECIAIDTTRVLIDHENDHNLPEDSEKRYQKCRHMLSDSTVNMTANVGATSKSWYSGYSFNVATWFKGLACAFVPNAYTVEVDDVQVESGNLETSTLMINNGKYSNGGLLINPFATVNDGLIDLTWVRDPAYFGMFGFKEIMNEAREGGIQAYKKHSIYMRGRKIKCTYLNQDAPDAGTPQNAGTPQEDGAEEPKEGKEEEEPQADEEGDKYVGVDHSDLVYRSSITWQCFPQNIEIMFDSDKYFIEFEAFPEIYERDDEHEKYLVDTIVEEMFEKYDADKSGDIDKVEAKKMIEDICMSQGRPFKASAFDQTFTMIDRDDSGSVDKHEMKVFVKAMIGA